MQEHHDVQASGWITSVVKDAEMSLGYAINPWKPEDAQAIYEKLEHPNWAPWLEASVETLANRAKVFPLGQLLLKPWKEYLASVSMNQIDWDGDVTHLPSWDDVAGDPTDYSKTYKPNGNTLVLMSMNVAPDHQGEHLPTKMITAAKEVAKQLGVTHLIGSFRPSGFGEAKVKMGYELDFGQYCHLKKSGGDQPLDPWLRSLWWNGMQMLAVDPKAMTVVANAHDFEQYLNYKRDYWVQIYDWGVWECGEVGRWIYDKKTATATYVESNMWGVIPLE